MKTKQAGFTLIELLMVVWFIAWVSVIIGVIYVVCHFVAKFW